MIAGAATKGEEEGEEREVIGFVLHVQAHKVILTTSDAPGERDQRDRGEVRLSK